MSAPRTRPRASRSRSQAPAPTRRRSTALGLLRNNVIPATIGRVPGVTVHTTGEAGTTVDFNNTMKSHAPYVFVFVLGLAFLLLLVTFRSIVIPLTAIVLNLLSVGAAYGVLVLIFQQGHLHSLLGFTPIGGIINWLPLFLFVILFGLSMDYHVFILSRIREAHDNGMSTEDAVAHGIKASAGVVTSAAIVMVAVFAIFATLGEIDLPDAGRRARRRHPDRRDHHPRGAATRNDEAARRLELVPAQLARMAPARNHRAGSWSDTRPSSQQQPPPRGVTGTGSACTTTPFVPPY